MQYMISNQGWGAGGKMSDSDFFKISDSDSIA